MLEKFSSLMGSSHDGMHGGEPSAYQFSHPCARSAFQFNVVGEHGSCCCHSGQTWSKWSRGGPATEMHSRMEQ